MKWMIEEWKVKEELKEMRECRQKESRERM